ncbi:PAS domain S-box protein [Vannielia litorea]|uniref:histidine kinase n=1 Tax=Vannielia litorea TaxID=1217970 RepID=A0A1N6IMB9_9RHOB|nr:PAS domain S-box protein [Vannielia litorea]SIO33190.1 PAS domain S-box-containing protein [Vannielia litorea]
MDESFDLKAHLAAIVENSDDAIITKNLDSIIQSWNRGAEDLFGYRAEEVVGRPITLLIPEERLHEEEDIIARLRRGERIRHFETIRMRKDGSLVPISLTVSPVRNAAGEVVGASKIARDITEQHRARELERQLLAEMRHRVGNCFSVASGLLNVFGRQASTPEDLVTMMRERLQALARAHALAVANPDDPQGGSGVMLDELVHSIVAPFTGQAAPEMKLDAIELKPGAITPMSLVIYELCTDAVKYGCLSPLGGRLSISSAREGDRLRITWAETCPLGEAADEPASDGFGTRMIRSTLAGYFEGSISRAFSPDGMVAVLDLDFDSLTHRAADPARAAE